MSFTIVQLLLKRLARFFFYSKYIIPKNRVNV